MRATAACASCRNSTCRATQPVGFPVILRWRAAKAPYEIVREPGVLTATMDPTRESTYKFLDGFIGEMAKLFPDAYFHIGGDEVSPRGEWYHNPHIAAFMKKKHLADFPALQAYFNKRVLENRHETRQAHGRMGRNPASRSAEIELDSILARQEIAGRGGAAGLQRDSVERILSRSDGPGRKALRRRSAQG